MNKIDLIIQENMPKSNDLSLYEYNHKLNSVKPIISNTSMSNIVSVILLRKYNIIWIEKSMRLCYLKKVILDDSNVKIYHHDDAQWWVDSNTHYTYISYWLLRLKASLNSELN